MSRAWSLLSNHGLALAIIASRPRSRIRDVAAALGVTERAAHRLIGELVAAGYLDRKREGRRNSYAVRGEKRLDAPWGPGFPVQGLFHGIGIPLGDGLSECEAVVLACSDHRIQTSVQRLLQELGLVGRAELLLWPGGGPALAGPHRGELFDVLADIFDRRAPERLVLVGHSDCQIPHIPVVAGADPPETFRSVRRWGRRIRLDCSRRLGLEPELWVVDRGKLSIVTLGGGSRRPAALPTISSGGGER